MQGPSDELLTFEIGAQFLLPEMLMTEKKNHRKNSTLRVRKLIS